MFIVDDLLSQLIDRSRIKEALEQREQGGATRFQSTYRAFGFSATCSELARRACAETLPFGAELFERALEGKVSIQCPIAIASRTVVEAGAMHARENVVEGTRHPATLDCVPASARPPYVPLPDPLDVIIPECREIVLGLNKRRSLVSEIVRRELTLDSKWAGERCYEIAIAITHVLEAQASNRIQIGSAALPQEIPFLSLSIEDIVITDIARNTALQTFGLAYATGYSFYLLRCLGYGN